MNTKTFRWLTLGIAGAGLVFAFKNSKNKSGQNNPTHTITTERIFGPNNQDLSGQNNQDKNTNKKVVADTFENRDKAFTRSFNDNYGLTIFKNKEGKITGGMNSIYTKNPMTLTAEGAVWQERSNTLMNAIPKKKADKENTGRDFFGGFFKNLFGGKK